MDNSAAQARLIGTALGSRTIGFAIRGLDATPTGTNAGNDAVADFTGAATQVSRGTAPTGAISPISHIPSQTLGSIFKIGMRGRWLVRAKVIAQTAAAVRAALSIDVAAGSLDAAVTPQVDGTTIQDSGQVVQAAAGDIVPISLQMVVDINDVIAADQLSGLVRLLITNNAGGPPPAATLVLADCMLSFERIGDINT